MRQIERTVQEYQTTLAPAEVIARAKTFFTERSNIYSAFLDKEGPTYVTFRGQGTEEVVIAATPAGAGTLVTGSTYLFDMQVARFFSTLPPFGSAERLLDVASDDPPVSS